MSHLSTTSGSSASGDFFPEERPSQSEERALDQPKKREKPVTILNTGTPVYGHNEAGRQICYRLKRNGERCQCPRVCPINGRCAKHGGRRVSGPLAPGYTHGKYSKYGQVLPQSYRRHFEQLANISDWMSLKEDITFTSTRIRQLIKDLQEAPDGVTLDSLTALAKRAQRILNTDPHNARRLNSLLQEFVETLEDANAERELHLEIQNTQGHLSRLITTEVRRREVEENSIPAYDAYVMFQSIIASIKNRCKDPHVLHLIANDLKGLTNAIRLPNTSHLFPEYIEGHPNSPAKIVEADFEDPPPIQADFYKGVDLVPDVDPDNPHLPVPIDPQTLAPRTREVILEAEVRNPTSKGERGNHNDLSAPRAPDLVYAPHVRVRKRGRKYVDPAKSQNVSQPR